MIGYGVPPALLRKAETVAYLVFRPRTGLPAGTVLPLEALAGDVADLAGDCMENVTLQSGAITLGTPSRHWQLY